MYSLLPQSPYLANVYLGDPNKPPAVRIERFKLQNALLSQVPPGVVQLSKKLVGIQEQADGVTLEFADGKKQGPFDLVVGADGIRSVSPRPLISPGH